MTAKIKLNAASGGGSFSLQAPSSSSNNRVFTLPDVADATLLTSNSSTGKILQVIQTKDIAEFSTTSTSAVEYAGINTTITPSSASNKILINVSLAVGASGNDNGQFGFLLYNGSSEITDATNTNVTNQTAAVIRMLNQFDAQQLNMQYLYSPNTTSAITIKVYAKGDTLRTLYLNRYGAGTGRGGVSSMILMEVAG